MARTASPSLADAHQLVDMDRLRSYSSDISPALSGFEPHREPGSWSCSVAASMMARLMPQIQFGVVAGQRVEGWVVGSAGWWTRSCSRRAVRGVPATGAGVPVDLLPGHGCKRCLLHAVTVPVRQPPATGVPGLASRFPRSAALTWLS